MANDNHENKIPRSEFRGLEALTSAIADMPKGSPRYALFLGAGASVSSGIPHAGELVNRWKETVFRDLLRGANRLDALTPTEIASKFEAWAQGDANSGLALRLPSSVSTYANWAEMWKRGQHETRVSDYSLLFSYVCGSVDQRQGYIEELINNKEPGPGYIYLASLVKNRHFDTILTTNFDDLAHDALFRYAGEKPVVCAFDSQVASVRLRSTRAKIIKLHGDFLFNNIRNLGNEVARLDRNMEEKFQRTCEDLGLLVLGYGGEDDSIMQPLRSMLTRDEYLKGGLHWCVYDSSISLKARLQNLESTRAKTGEANPTSSGHGGSTPSEEGIRVPGELYRMWERHRNKVHLYLVPTFDEVMESFYLKCACSPPPELDSPQEKALYARLQDGLDRTSERIYVTEYFNGLLDRFRQATQKPVDPEVWALQSADFLHHSATIKAKRGRLYLNWNNQEVGAGTSTRGQEEFKVAALNFEKAIAEGYGVYKKLGGTLRLADPAHDVSSGDTDSGKVGEQADGSGKSAADGSSGAADPEAACQDARPSGSDSTKPNSLQTMVHASRRISGSSTSLVECLYYQNQLTSKPKPEDSHSDQETSKAIVPEAKWILATEDAWRFAKEGLARIEKLSKSELEPRTNFGSEEGHLKYNLLLAGCYLCKFKPEFFCTEDGKSAWQELMQLYDEMKSGPTLHQTYLVELEGELGFQQFANMKKGGPQCPPQDGVKPEDIAKAEGAAPSHAGESRDVAGIGEVPSRSETAETGTRKKASKS